MPRQTDAVSAGPRRRRRRRLYTDPADRTCGRCRTPIPAGTEHHRDVSGTAHHPACVRLGVRQPAAPPPPVPRVVLLQPQARRCACCEQPVAGEPSVTVQGVPWHKECWRAMT